MTDMIYFTSRNNSQIPRIVAAKLKTQFKNKVGFNDCGIKTRISGDLRIVDRSFRHLRYAEIRDGCLILYRYVGNNKVWDFNIPLYNLNINLDSPQYYCQFSLSKFGEIAPIATFQVVKEQTYKKWLKTLAVEVIRQTPLNTLKFMDILFIGELLERHQPRSKSRCNLSPCESGRDGRTPRATIYSGNDIDSLNETCSTSTDPLTDSSHGFIDTPRNDSPHCDSLDKHNHSNYCVDSGYCSWQSAPKSDISESETGSIKPFEQLCQKFQVQQANESNSTPRPKLDPRHKSATLDCTWSLKNDPKFITGKENHLPDINMSCYTNKQLPQWMKKPKQEYESRSETPEPSSPISPNPYVTRFFNENNIKRSYRGSLDMTMESSSLPWEVNGNHIDAIPDVLRDLPDTLPRTKRKSSTSFKFNEDLIRTENATLLVKLLTKCQIDKEYVPVREKRLLFESLSRFSFSMDNLKKRIMADTPEEESFVKFRSLLDLNGSPVPVSAMRKYFESFNEKDEK